MGIGEKMTIESSDLKVIPDFPDYSITKDGRVWSNPRKYRRKGRWLKFKTDSDGYYQVTLCFNTKKFSCQVHRLVLTTWDKSCPKGKQCRHLNGNKQDNRIVNLQWGTAKENTEDRDFHGTTARGEKIGNAKLTKSIVCEIKSMYRTKRYSHRKIAKLFLVGKTTITHLLNGDTWKHINA